MDFFVTMPHNSAIIQEDYRRVSGETAEEVRHAAHAACRPGHYVASVQLVEDGKPTTYVYREGEGWSDEVFDQLKAA